MYSNKSQLNLDLLRQLSKILYICNPFINIYKTAAKQIQFLAINTTEKIGVILNPWIKLLLELGADCGQSNLLTIDKKAIIILEESNQSRFYNIVLAYCYHKNNNNEYYNVSSNSATYMPLYYILFFSSSNLRWHWALSFQDLDG